MPVGLTPPEELSNAVAELPLVAAVRRVRRDEGGPMPTTMRMDVLLDERLTHRGWAVATDTRAGSRLGARVAR